MNKTIYKLLATKVRPIEFAALLKRILLIKRRYFNINNNYWFLDPVSNFGFRLLNENHYEPEMTETILGLLNEGDSFIDLGANEGYFSILASKKTGANGKVYCIEPQQRLWEVILKNINKNNCYNINLIPFAISDRVEEIAISLSPSINTGSSSFVKESRRRLWETQELFSTTLDDLFLEHDAHSIKLIKIDIEGYEFFALKGAVKLLQKKVIKNILIEFHPAQLKALGHTAEGISDFLKGYGYTERNAVYSCSI